jgi:hypothetical protein
VILADCAALLRGRSSIKATGEYGDMAAMRVVGPTKVTRTTLQNAASVSSLMLTTDCMIAEAPADGKSTGSLGGMNMQFQHDGHTPRPLHENATRNHY